MGAIGAIYERSGAPASAQAMADMAAALRVHGPLAGHHQCLGPVALCWNKLADFTPEDRHDAQPVEQGPLAMVFTGRLHFRKDLARALGLDSGQAAQLADGALACAAWLRWGEEALERLEGTYALIVWDRRTGSLTAARAPHRAPPLVYHQRGQQLALASAPRGLFALPGVVRQLNEQRVADALIGNNRDGSASYFHGVASLGCGQCLKATPGGISLRRFWQLEPPEPLRLGGDAAYVEAAEALVRDAVADAMHAAVTPACTISAGLDSPTVAHFALAAAAQGNLPSAEPLIGYTAVPEPGWQQGSAMLGKMLGDESGPVRAFAAMHPGFAVHFVDSAGVPMDSNLDRLIALAEGPPFGWNNLHWNGEIDLQVRAQGRNVLLNGSSGNRTLSFGAKTLLVELFRRGQWRELQSYMAEIDDGLSLSRRYLHRVVRPQLPAALDRLLTGQRSQPGQAGWARFSAINPQFAADMQVAERARALGWDVSFSRHTSPRQQLLAKADGGGAGTSSGMGLAGLTLHGIEGRDPLGYQRISRFVLAIPERQFRSPQQDRWLIHRLMQGRLPREILTAPRATQAADWHLRLTRDLPRYRQEVARMADDTDLARMFDVPRMLRLLDSWPTTTPTSAAVHPEHLLAHVGLGRAIGMSRFINWARTADTPADHQAVAPASTAISAPVT